MNLLQLTKYQIDHWLFNSSISYKLKICLRWVILISKTRDICPHTKVNALITIQRNLCWEHLSGGREHGHHLVPSLLGSLGEGMEQSQRQWGSRQRVAVLFEWDKGQNFISKSQREGNMILSIRMKAKNQINLKA